MGERAGIRRAQSRAVDARAAVREFHDGVAQPDIALVIFFCSAEYDLEALADEMRLLFGEVPVVGCTTAGEIGPIGYIDHSISGASFPAEDFTATCGLVEQLGGFEIADGLTFVQQLISDLESRTPSANAENTFAFMLIDGMSLREEPVAHALQSGLGEIPFVGGSAADGLAFSNPSVFFEGHFRTDAAVLTLCSTPLPFAAFKTQHFVPMEQRVVITDADPEHRVVRQIGGRAAVEAYADLAGVAVDQLDPPHFAATPMVVVLDGTNYVRSVKSANPDGSLTFFCAIDEGMVLRSARGEDLVGDLKRAFADIRDAVGDPQLVITFDCLQRRLEVIRSGLLEQVEDVLERNNATGFGTLGEQYHGVHINQTLTAIAIGRPAAGAGSA